MLRIKRPRLVTAVVVALLCLLSASGAWADILSGTIFLLPSGSTLGPYPAPYATVTINRTDSDDADVTFHAVLTGGYQYLIAPAGGSNLVGLALSSTAVTVTGLTGSLSCAAGITCSGFTAYPPNLLAAVFPPAANPFAPPPTIDQKVDGVGNYNLQIVTDGSGFTDALTDISFHLHLTSGSWATASAIISTSFSGFGTSWAEAHIAVCDIAATAQGGANTCSPAKTAIATAWAGGAVQGVPEPGTLALLGTGLVLLGALGRRFKS